MCVGKDDPAFPCIPQHVHPCNCVSNHQSGMKFWDRIDERSRRLCCFFKRREPEVNGSRPQQGIHSKHFPHVPKHGYKTNLHGEEPFQCIALLATASSEPNHRISLLTDVLDSKLKLQNQSDQFTEEGTIKEKPQLLAQVPELQITGGWQSVTAPHCHRSGQTAVLLLQ